MYQKILSQPALRGSILVGLSGMLFGWRGFFGTQILHHDFTIENMLFWRFLIAAHLDKLTPLRELLSLIKD